MAAQPRTATGTKLRKIRGVDGMTIAAVRSAIAGGGRFVVFPYTESWLIASFRRISDPVLVKPGDSMLRLAGTPILHSLLFGWWGIPWGPIWTISTIWKALHGGVDVTAAVMPELELAYDGRQLEPISTK